MILVDTSVWIDFLRRGNDRLSNLLNQNRVVTHPLILGELSMGNLSKWEMFLECIRNLPIASEASHDEVLLFVEKNRMWGKGLGFFDLHLLCASLIESIPLWTLDKNLAKAARTFGPKINHE